jgi:hypothetical protein
MGLVVRYMGKWKRKNFRMKFKNENQDWELKLGIEIEI